MRLLVYAFCTYHVVSFILKIRSSAVPKANPGHGTGQLSIIPVRFYYHTVLYNHFKIILTGCLQGRAILQMTLF